MEVANPIHKYTGSQLPQSQAQCSSNQHPTNTIHYTPVKHANPDSSLIRGPGISHTALFTHNINTSRAHTKRTSHRPSARKPHRNPSPADYAAGCFWRPAKKSRQHRSIAEHGSQAHARTLSCADRTCILNSVRACVRSLSLLVVVASAMRCAHVPA